jgi:hypothetical protein
LAGRWYLLRAGDAELDRGGACLVGSVCPRAEPVWIEPASAPAPAQRPALGQR